MIAGSDTIYFPEDLILNIPTIFKANKDSNKYALKVTRINLTTLIYNFQITDLDNKAIVNKSGKAILSSTFFFAPEGDDDFETQSGYGSQEYRDNTGSSWLSIRIEIGKADDGRQRAKIKFSDVDTTKKSLDLDECPTLRTE